jgi:O-antigen/teichoic acid export membrane protein
MLNFIGQAVPLVVGVVTIPFIVRGLGTERFGLLSLAWVILGYFAIFDLGLGRATTKFVAEALGKGEEDQIPRLVWTAVTVQGILGVIGAFVVAGITPLLVERILNIPPALIGEAKGTFYLLALAVPVILISSSFSGVLEAKQRFDLVNAVKIPSSTLIFLLPLVGLLLGFHLPGIVMLILLVRFGALLALVVLTLHIFPKIKKFSARFALFPRLFAFGGWITVSSIVSPVLVYLDRFLIASLLSVAAVAYYTAPYEAVTRLLIIPGSLTITLFPAFSALEGIRDWQRIGMLFARPVKYVLLTIGPIILIVMLFAKEILQIWLGVDFATKSVAVLQVLAFGVFINCLAQIPFALLQGVGRPDLPAKFHMLELPIYIGIAWILVSTWGIVGAAAAWTLRVALDALLLFVAAFKVCRLAPRLLATNGLTLTSLALLLLAGVTYGLKSLIGAFPLFVQSGLFMALLSLFAWLTWKGVLDNSERRAILKVVKLRKEPEIGP